MIQNFFYLQKTRIANNISEIVEKAKSELGLSKFGNNALSKIHQLSLDGKMIRGGLFIKSCEIFNYTDSDTILVLAATLELIQSGLLIHDDIMDNDLVRRGSPSVFAQYLPQAKSLKVTSSENYAKAIGIGVGDLTFFLAYYQLGKTKLPPGLLSKVYQLISRELIGVTDGQLNDIYFGGSKVDPSLLEIERIYLTKTAYYTFYLPLVLGAVLGKQDQAVVRQLKELSESLGMIFQIKDDELGFFASESEIGKPVGSDIRENKKTWLRNLLFEKANSKQKLILNRYFGNPKLTAKNLGDLRKIAFNLKIDKQIRDKMHEYQKSTDKIIFSLPIDAAHQQFLFDLTEYLLTRTK